jgi:hypothetical protein
MTTDAPERGNQWRDSAQESWQYYTRIGQAQPARTVDCSMLSVSVGGPDAARGTGPARVGTPTGETCAMRLPAASRGAAGRMATLLRRAGLSHVAVWACHDDVPHSLCFSCERHILFLLPAFLSLAQLLGISHQSLFRFIREDDDEYCHHSRTRPANVTASTELSFLRQRASGDQRQRCRGHQLLAMLGVRTGLESVTQSPCPAALNGSCPVASIDAMSLGVEVMTW